jgi:hypothetical protein
VGCGCSKNKLSKGKRGGKKKAYGPASPARSLRIRLIRSRVSRPRRGRTQVPWTGGSDANDSRLAAAPE